MRWRSRRRSDRVEDQRGRGVGGSAASMGQLLGLVSLLGRGRGGKVILILLIVAAVFILPRLFGGYAETPGSGVETAPGPAGAGTPGDELGEFASVVLASTEDAWTDIFAESGLSYDPPTMVLYDDVVQSACGFSSAATGPFYCPGDGRLYLDLGFFRELARMGAPGDFAAAYVIGHEVGHHVQNLLGTAEAVREAQRTATEHDANALSVLLELQADCLAGVWAHRSERQQTWLEAGDVEEGLEAAGAIGDDRLQRQAGGAVQPESFTHGTSAQRQQWLRTGLETGSVRSCDTFSDAGFF